MVRNDFDCYVFDLFSCLASLLPLGWDDNTTPSASKSSFKKKSRAETGYKSRSAKKKTKPIEVFNVMLPIAFNHYS